MNLSILTAGFESSLLGQAIINESGKFLFINQSFCQTIGYAKERLSTLSLQAIIIEENENDMSNFQFILKKGIRQAQFQKNILHGEGFLQSITFTITDISSGNEVAYHIQTDKLMMPSNLRNSQQLTDIINERDEVRLPKKILDGIKDAVITIRLDGQFLYANEEAERMFGKREDELLEKNFWEYLELDQNKELSNKIYLLLAGEDYIEIEYYLENLQCWYNVRAYRSDERVTMYFMNITNRKKMEQELRESEKRYRSLVEHTPETISVHDGENIIYMNPAGNKLFGATNRKELVGKKLSELLARQELTRVKENNRLLLAGKKRVTTAIVTIKKLDGTMLEVESTSTIILFRGKPVFRTILKDISERKKVDDLIRKSDKLSVVAQLAAGVAHEIRNPLTTVKGFLQLFQNEESYNGYYLKLMMEELERVESIIYEYLTLAKPNYEQDFQNIRIDTLLKQLLTLTETHSNMINIKLEFNAEEVPIILGLEKELKQVFINIIRNAMEAVEENGIISVRVRNHPDDFVCIQVEDNGCGMPRERIERLGEPFYSTKERGTGLGLMVCYKIIEHHGGILNVYSEVNRGTKVEIILPTLKKRKKEMLMI
ncbi:PAS domain S-box protein [Halalkalibacter nanhaiisediminis]|uniref:histidine kinase n=1 Tax=Halalkalibacter nanhaiisediminis TaxID=688079 RepID=A0A562QM81_9BACI|nr:PAS domain S-box protein [Halalkalibacter nanhaiisediminis]TWI57862.1 two-component system sporulation sensor kinase A [Halalkalibacter nanhaiisediminis]